MADLTSNQLCNICCKHYNAGLRCCALGSLVEGGYLFARQGGVAWIVACASREVSRVWASRGDAVTVANASDACGDWFVPCRDDTKYGVECRCFWDSSSNNKYWTSTEYDATWAFYMVCNGFRSGIANKTTTFCVRAFRRVFY